jgi:hypothetical protein
MQRRVILLAGSLVVSACSAPTETATESPALAVGSHRAAAVSEVSLRTSEATSPRPETAIEDALARLLPSLTDQSLAKDLRQPLQEAVRLLGRGDGAAAEGALTRVRAIVHGLENHAAGDPDLVAVILALEPAR